LKTENSKVGKTDNRGEIEKKFKGEGFFE